MNSLKEIYNNVINNVKKYYINENNLSGARKQIMSNLDVFVQKAINGQNYGTKIATVAVSGITSDDIENIIDSNVKKSPDNNQYTVNIPVHLWFVSSNLRIQNYMTTTSFDNTYVLGKPAFIICILTHHMYNSSSKINLKQFTESIVAPEYFLRVFSYKEFSIDIFDHIYQPRFTIIRGKDTIDQILKQYMINLSSVASIYNSDPVNKRLLGLPSFTTTIVITGSGGSSSNLTFNKEFPDMYKITQPSNITYRKVVYSKEKNPFAV